jgi:hypothetical protein
MAVRTKSRRRYTTDTGVNYSINVLDDQSADTRYGLPALSGGEVSPPDGFDPRYVLLMEPGSGRSFKRIVGNIAAAAWATPLVGSYSINEWNSITGVDTVITTKVGERFEFGSRPVPAP